MRSTYLKACGIVLAAALSVPAFAQGTTGSGSATGSNSGTTTMPDTTVRHDDRGFDWGWLGLLGLLGLGGLRKQPDIQRTETTRSSATR